MIGKKKFENLFSTKHKDILKCLRTIDLEQVYAATIIIDNSLNKGNKLIAFGNGGSAAQAQHFTAEFVGLLRKPAISINTDTSNLTALANDFGFNDVFSRQIQTIGKAGDVAIGISTSGNSENILNAVDECKKMQIITIGLTGSRGRLREIVDHKIEVGFNNTQTTQEIHQIILHMIFEALHKNK